MFAGYGQHGKLDQGSKMSRHTVLAALPEIVHATELSITTIKRPKELLYL